MMHSIFKVLKQRTSEQTEEKLTIEQFGLLHTISEKEEEVLLKRYGMYARKRLSLLFSDSSTVWKKRD